MRMLKDSRLLFVVGLLCFSGQAFAAQLGEQEVDITLTSSFVSRYIWRGQDLLPDNDGAWQPSVDIAFPNLIGGTDVALNVWGSFALSGRHEQADELDYTLSASRDFLDAFNVSTGFTYFDYPQLNQNSDVNEFWGSFTLLKLPVLPIDVSLTLWAGYDFEARAEGVENGWYYSWGFDTELPLPECPLFQDGQTIGLGIVNLGNDGVGGLKPAGLYATEFSASTSYSFKGFTISEGLHYVVSHEDGINDGDDEFWSGIDISYAF